MIIYAAAKLNLCLDVLKKDSSGYHKIQTILHEVPELKNCIEIRATKRTPDASRPKDLANQAVHLLQKTYKLDQLEHQGLELKIDRNILPGSGLGGESSNAAAVLKALNELWSLNLSRQELLTLAAQLGMDVPFFIVGGTALGTHYGEKISPLPPLKGLNIKIHQKASALPDKTKAAYLGLELANCSRQKSKTKALLELMTNKEDKAIYKELPGLLHNDFETLAEYSDLAKNSHLCGSGPSTFQVYV